MHDHPDLRGIQSALGRNGPGSQAQRVAREVELRALAEVLDAGHRIALVPLRQRTMQTRGHPLDPLGGRTGGCIRQASPTCGFCLPGIRQVRGAHQRLA